MSGDLATSKVDQRVVRQRRAALLPAVVATCIGVPLLVLSIVIHVVGEVVVHSQPDVLPAGVNDIAPSSSDRARLLAEQAVPVVAAVGLLVLTWWFRRQGRRGVSLVCPVATVLLAAVSLG